MAAAHSVGLTAYWPSTQGSALPRSTLGFMLASAPRTKNSSRYYWLALPGMQMAPCPKLSPATATDLTVYALSMHSWRSSDSRSIARYWSSV